MKQNPYSVPFLVSFSHETKRGEVGFSSRIIRTEKNKVTPKTLEDLKQNLIENDIYKYIIVMSVSKLEEDEN